MKILQSHLISIARRNAGYKQAVASEKLGVDIGSIENNRTPVTPATLEKIAKLFRVDVRDLNPIDTDELIVTGEGVSPKLQKLFPSLQRTMQTIANLAEDDFEPALILRVLDKFVINHAEQYEYTREQDSGSTGSSKQTA